MKTDQTQTSSDFSNQMLAQAFGKKRAGQTYYLGTELSSLLVLRKRFENASTIIIILSIALMPSKIAVVYQ